MLKVLIIEDYDDDAEALASAVQAYGDAHELSFDIDRSDSASVLAARSKVYDIIFLDIGLPGMDGMDAATLLRTYDTTTPIIFVTNLSQYAARSYEVDAAGFIVKPITQPKVEICLDKIAWRLRAPGADKIVMETEGGIRVIPIRDVRYVELVRHNLVFHLVSSTQPITIRGTIRQLENTLTQDTPLLKISSGCLVNMDYVSLVKGSSVHMENGIELPLSRRRRKDAIDAFATYLGKSF